MRDADGQWSEHSRAAPRSPTTEKEVGGSRRPSREAGPNPTSKTSPSTLLLGLLACLGSVACEQNEDSAESTVSTLEASPNASIPPSPLLSGSSLVSKLPKPAVSTKSTKGAVEREPLVPLPIHQTLPADEEPAKSGPTVVLNARFSWPTYPPALRLWGVDDAAQEAFLNATQRLAVFTLRPHGRMQVTFSGRAYAFDDRVALQSRIDNTGHVLVWPSGTNYRVLSAGTLRALFNEGRPDATPLLNVEVEPRRSGQLLGYATRVWNFETPHGKLALQQAELAEAERGAPLMCRFLVELMSIAPTTSACDNQRTPLRAEFETTKGARLSFEVTNVDVTLEASPSNILVPPKQSTLRNGVPSARDLSSAMERAALRRGNKTGTIVVHNSSEQLRYLLLDGVPMARVGPRTSMELSGVSQGQYLARLVDFWGNDSLPSTALEVRDAVTIGEPAQVVTEPEL